MMIEEGQVSRPNLEAAPPFIAEGEFCASQASGGSRSRGG